MAFCTINMTLENRRDFGAMAMLLHMLLAAIGVVLIFCYFVIRRLLDELHGLLYQHYSSLYVESVVVVGAAMVLIHGYGVKMCLHVGNWKKLYRSAFSWKVMMYLFLAVTFVLLVVVVLFLVVTADQDPIAIAAGTSAMNTAVGQYKMNIVMKMAVDRVQLKNECCGSVTYLEWFTHSWIDDAYIPSNAPATARKYSFPFSCCKRQSERPCIDVDVNNAAAHYKYNPSTDVTVYRVGCNLGVTRVLREVVYANIRFYGWIAFVLELLAFVLFRYVQTSTDVALSWSDPTLICPGYLCNIGAPAIPLSKTTNIEEFSRQQERLEETIAMDEDMKIKDDDGGDDEEPVSRWHKPKSKKKKDKQNRTTNNRNVSERHDNEVIYANTGYSSNNNSATSADNSDNEAMLMMTSSSRRQARREHRRRTFSSPLNASTSNRNESAASSRRGSVSGSQDAGQDDQGEEGTEEEQEDVDEFKDQEEEELANIRWENELQGRSSRLSVSNLVGKPPLPPSAQRLSVDNDDPQLDAVVDDGVKDYSDDNQPDDLGHYEPDTAEPYDGAMDATGGDGDAWIDEAMGVVGDVAGMFPNDGKDRDKRDRSRDKKKGRDKSGSRDRRGRDKKKDRHKSRKESKDGKRGDDKSRSRDRKRHKDRKGDSKGRKERKRDGSKKDKRNRKSDTRGGGDKKKRDRTRSKDKKSKSRDKRSKSKEKKKRRSKDGKKRSGRSSGGRKSGGKKSGGRKSKGDKKSSKKSSGGRKSGGKKNRSGGSPGGRKSGGSKGKKAAKKLHRK